MRRPPPWLPNAITALRIALVPAWLAAAEALRASALAGDSLDRRWVVGIFLAIGVSDVIDGLLARRFGLATPLGSLLDAAADKLAQIAAVTYLALRGGPAFEALPLWLLLTLASRDLLLAGGWAWLRALGLRVETEHRWHGKAASLALFFLVLAVCAGIRGPGIAAGAAAAAALVVPSTVAYLAAGRRQRRAFALRHFRAGSGPTPLRGGAMNKDRLAGYVFGALLIAGAIGYMSYQLQLSTPGTAVRVRAEARARQWIAGWPDDRRLLAQEMINRYGPPEIRGRRYLQWESRSPWKRIVVRRDAGEAPVEHAVSYNVRPEDVAPLVSFGHGLVVNQIGQELASRDDDESLNRLTLNLADEIARGKRTPGEARDLFDRLVALRAAGKESPYFEGLLFEPAPRRVPPRMMPFVAPPVF